MRAQTSHPTVRDLYVEALAMKTRRVPPRHIADNLVGMAKGHGRITERGAGTGIEIIFHATGEVIHFDGRDWHLIREMSNAT